MKKIALIVTISILLASISVVQFNTVVHASPDYEYKKPTAFTDASGEWSSEANAYDLTTPNDITTYALGLTITDFDPSVTFHTWGTKVETYTATDLFVNWKTGGTWGNDQFAIQYTKDGGGLWSDLVVLGVHNETTTVQSTVALDANQDLTLVQVKVAFNMQGQPDAGGEIHICDIWTRGAYLTWESYDDASQSNVWGTVENPYASATQTAYMYGTGFATTTNYVVAYYDAGINGGVNQTTDGSISSDGSGILQSQWNLTTDPAAAAGLWHCVVFIEFTDAPDFYDNATAHGDKVVEDSFNVEPSAIPEFPTIMAAIGVAGLCFGIYWWMKRRLVYVKA